MTSATARARAARRASGLDPDAHHRLEGLAAQLDAASADRFAELRRQAGEGRAVVRGEMMSVVEALADPALAEDVREALGAAYVHAHGAGSGLLSECYTCGEHWDRLRVPALAVVVEVSRPAARFVSFCCVGCAHVPIDRLRTTIAEGLRRDFHADPLPISSFSPAAGHA